MLLTRAPRVMDGMECALPLSTRAYNLVVPPFRAYTVVHVLLMQPYRRAA
jgi:hypothetical protein